MTTSEDALQLINALDRRQVQEVLGVLCAYDPEAVRRAVTLVRENPPRFVQSRQPLPTGL